MLLTLDLVIERIHSSVFKNTNIEAEDMKGGLKEELVQDIFRLCSTSKDVMLDNYKQI